MRECELRALIIHSEKKRSIWNFNDSESHVAAMKLRKAIGCTVMFMLIQMTGGYFAGSLAVISDAAHLLMDAGAFFISLHAIYMGSYPSTAERPFGYQRAEVFGVLMSILAIWIARLWLIFTASIRLIVDENDDHVDGKIMFSVALFGLFSNVILIQVLGHNSHAHGSHCALERNERQESPLLSNKTNQDKTESATSVLAHEIVGNENVRAAYIHVIGDLIQSLGVCIAGALIWYNPSWQLADPVAAIVFGLIVFGTTRDIFKRNLDVLMESSPPGMNIKSLEVEINALQHVLECHEIRVWSICMSKVAGMVHVTPVSSNAAGKALKETRPLLQAHGIQIETVQVDID